MVYDQRILTWKNDCASIATINGRTVILFLGCDYYEGRKGIKRGQADLIFKNGVFFLSVIVDVPEAEEIKPLDAIGIDLGIFNLTVDSDGETHSSEAVCKTRGRIAKLYAALQSCSTKSAIKHLKRFSGKEKRFQRNINHCISKQIVTKAKDTKRAIALEDLRRNSLSEHGFEGAAS